MTSEVRVIRIALSVLLFCATVMFDLSSCQADEQQQVIVVVGAQGTDEYGAMFSEWADRWQTAAGLGNAGVVVVGRSANVGDDADDLQTLETQLSESINVKTLEPLWIVLIGHGTFDGRIARFNLRGPDLSADHLAKLLATSQRPVAIINCSSCSSPFINALSGPDRIVITGTKDGGEIQFARFGNYISDAIGKLDADLDRDGQTSLLEAWVHASGKTDEYYKSDGRLATEHSLLDDSGDGKGTRAEVYEGVRIRDNVKNKDQLDGKLARRWHLVRSEAERSLTPQQREMRNKLEEQLEQLRKTKSDFSEPEYLRQLEKILLPLARLYNDAESASNPETTEKADP